MANLIRDERLGDLQRRRQYSERSCMLSDDASGRCIDYLFCCLARTERALGVPRGLKTFPDAFSVSGFLLIRCRELPRRNDLDGRAFRGRKFRRKRKSEGSFTAHDGTRPTHLSVGRAFRLTRASRLPCGSSCGRNACVSVLAGNQTDGHGYKPGTLSASELRKHARTAGQPTSLRSGLQSGRAPCRSRGEDDQGSVLQGRTQPVTYHRLGARTGVREMMSGRFKSRALASVRS
jgi:hypothetical protein